MRGALGSGRAAGVSVPKQKEPALKEISLSVIKVDLILLVPQHQSGYFLIRPYVYGM
jgi:hypothetical protein